eukprot:768143-Hanusia_phi.AAC.1
MGGMEDIWSSGEHVERANHKYSRSMIQYSNGGDWRSKRFSGKEGQACKENRRAEGSTEAGGEEMGGEEMGGGGRQGGGRRSNASART